MRVCAFASVCVHGRLHGTFSLLGCLQAQHPDKCLGVVRAPLKALYSTPGTEGFGKFIHTFVMAHDSRVFVHLVRLMTTDCLYTVYKTLLFTLF